MPVSTLRSLRPTPSLVISTLALAVALGGGAYAVAADRGPTLPKNSVISKTVKNGSLKAKDFKAGQLPAGPAGPPGPVGPQGVPGPFVDTLPSGKTLRGTYSFGSYSPTSGGYGSTGITFAFPLSAPPTPHYVAMGSTAPAACPGTTASPQALAGHFCVYEGSIGSVSERGISNSETLTNKTDTFGAIIYALSGAGDAFNVAGSWAVTAP